MPRTGLVVVEAEFVLGRLKAVLNRPAMPFHGNKSVDGRAGWTPGREESQFAIGDMTPDQKPPGPCSCRAIGIFVSLKVGEFEIGPVVKALALGAFACRQAVPCAKVDFAHNLGGGAGHNRLVAPGAEAMVALHAEHIPFAGTPQRLLDITDAVDGIRRDPGERHIGRDHALDHLDRQRRLGGKSRAPGHMRGRQPFRIGSPALGQVQRPVDEGMPFGRDVGGEHADLTVRHLTRRPGVMAPHTTRRLALLQEPSLIDDQHRIIGAEMLDGIVAHDVAQSIRIPPPAAQDRLLAPWPGIASSLAAHPSGLAPLIAQQSIQKAVRRCRNALLAEQGAHPRLHVAQR